jgi:Uncharacterized conserved protein related to C-terminal domain of eukaryotic chaperone, SACSIN
MNEDQVALVNYRLEQAERTLRQAEILAEYAEWNGVVNRAYYAMFYGALALLLTKNLGSSKHTGVLALIDREFVHTKIISVEVSMMLRDAFNERQKSDYSEFVPVSEQRAKEILKNAHEVLSLLKNAIKALP